MLDSRTPKPEALTERLSLCALMLPHLFARKVENDHHSSGPQLRTAFIEPPSQGACQHHSKYVLLRDHIILEDPSYPYKGCDSHHPRGCQQREMYGHSRSYQWKCSLRVLHGCPQQQYSLSQDL